MIPVKANDVAGKIAAWGVEIEEDSENIPGIQLPVKGQEDTAKKYGLTLGVGPLERPGDGLNMGWIPLLDYGTAENELEAG